MDNKEWRIEEMTPKELEELQATKQATCQDDVPDGESGMGGPEGADDVDPVMIGEGE